VDRRFFSLYNGQLADGYSVARVRANAATQDDLVNAAEHFTVGRTPLGLAFDGVNIWVTNTGVNYFPSPPNLPSGNSVTRLRAKDGMKVGPDLTGFNTPTGIIFDGTNMWIANFAINSYGGNLTRLNISTGERRDFTVVGKPWNLIYDGANIWVISFDPYGATNSGTISKLRASDGVLRWSFVLTGEPYGIAFDGAHVWVTTNDNKVWKF
jgi:hypothetical protein